MILLKIKQHEFVHLISLGHADGYHSFNIPAKDIGYAAPELRLLSTIQAYSPIFLILFPSFL